MSLSESALAAFEVLWRKEIAQVATVDDPAHDLLHFERVVATAKKLCASEGANRDVVVPAAWLHDLVLVPKNDPRRAQASRLSAERAVDLLSEMSYPADLHAEIAHAIAAHSFSANIEVRSSEAAVVQDADRLDGLGAIGIARVFATSGLMRRALYDAGDPFCRERSPDDQRFTIDHFYAKLFKTVETLRTEAGRREGQRRARVMRAFLENLRAEL